MVRVRLTGAFLAEPFLAEPLLAEPLPAEPDRPEPLRDPEVDLETPPSARTAKGGTVVLKDLVLVPDLPGQAKILLGKEEKKPYLELIGVAAGEIDQINMSQVRRQKLP